MAKLWSAGSRLRTAEVVSEMPAFDFLREVERRRLYEPYNWVSLQYLRLHFLLSRLSGLFVESHGFAIVPLGGYSSPGCFAGVNGLLFPLLFEEQLNLGPDSFRFIVVRTRCHLYFLVLLVLNWRDRGVLDGAGLLFGPTLYFEVFLCHYVIVRGGVEDEVDVEDPCLWRRGGRVVVVAAEGEGNLLVSVRISDGIFFIPHAYIMLR